MFFYKTVIMDFRPAKPGSGFIDRITRIREQHDIPRAEGGHAQMSHSFLCSRDGYNCIRINHRTVPFPVISGDRIQHFPAVTKRIFIIPGIQRGSRNRFTHMGGRLKIRRAYGEVVHGSSRVEKLLLFGIHCGKDTGCKMIQHMGLSVLHRSPPSFIRVCSGKSL